MEMQAKIDMAEKNIRQALQDYGKYTDDTRVLDCVSNEFIRRLAADSTKAKQDLRELFRKSPCWNEELDALVINGTRTHDLNRDTIWYLGITIYENAAKGIITEDNLDVFLDALRFFACPDVENDVRETYIAAIERLAPGAYAPNKKPSRIFRDVCVAQGIADETAGSEFQRLYAKFADELSAKKIDFKLYVSINPAHFLTMSNPKGDRRGATLTSCHSFNSTEYSYNVGCSGYARDNTSFIVFTVADPNDPETFNNRKTTRQIFAYRPGSGLLLQSRMYNTGGGVYGAVEESRLYRDLVQREISMLEDMPNIWKTYSSTGSYSPLVKAGRGFGGYQDWAYSQFDGRISIRNDCDVAEGLVSPLVVGTYGLCIKCGEEISDGLCCFECDDGDGDEDMRICDFCGAEGEDVYSVRNSDGDWITVCEDCRDEHFDQCDQCGTYWTSSVMTEIDGAYYCPECRDQYCEQCAECGEWHTQDRMVNVVRNGERVLVCDDCANQYYGTCSYCGELVPLETLNEVETPNGPRFVCDEFIGNYPVCPSCGEIIEPNSDGTCPACGANVTEMEDIA